jgi:virginiamycin B lyase
MRVTTSRGLWAVIAGLAVLGLGAGPAAALSITQFALPDYQCGGARCAPGPAQSIYADGPERVLLGGVVSGSVYGEVTLGASLTLTAGPSGSEASAIVGGPDGNPWILDGLTKGEVSYSAVQDVTPQGVQPRYVYPTAGASSSMTYALGATWVAHGGGVDRIGPLGEFTSYELPNPLATGAHQIVAGPDDSMWFTVMGDGAIGQIAASGEVSEHSSEPAPIDLLRSVPSPYGIAAGPDGALWYTDSDHERIGRIAPNGEVQEFQIPNHSPSPFSSERPMPEAIVAGPEGKYMYFTDSADGAIGRVSMAGEVTEFPIPGVTPIQPNGIVAVGNQLVVTEAGPTLAVVNPSELPGEVPLSTPPAVEAVAAALREQIASVAKVASTALGHDTRSFPVMLRVLEPGTLTLEWFAEASSRGHERAAPVLVAKGETGFAMAGASPIAVKLTAAGVRLLKQPTRHHPVRHFAQPSLALHADFSGRWDGPFEASAHQPIVR